MAKVYAPQIPQKRDAPTKLWIPSINIDPALKYGELVVMLPPNANRLHIAPLVAALQEQMANYTRDDYLVAVGDPSLIAAAACIAIRRTNGLLRILKWDRLSSTYLPVEVEL